MFKKKDGQDLKHLCSVKLLNEGPEVIGIMTTVFENGGSLDTAIREIASNGPAISSKLFSEIVFDADTRIDADMANSLSRMISGLPDKCTSYGMAVRMAVSASSAREANERSRILREASEIALDGLRMAGKSFTASLNTPCMVIFSVGIMIPMILMSILPMMGMSGLFGSSALDQDKISIITLVLIPAVILALIAGLGDKNPFAKPNKDYDLKPALPLISVIPIYIAFSSLLSDVTTAVALSVIATGAVTSALLVKGDRLVSRTCKAASAVENAIFEVGNRLLCGTTFENALTETLSSRKLTEDLAYRFGNEIDICRGNIENAITNIFSPISMELAGSLQDIYRAAVKNPLDGGKLAISLGRQMNDHETLRKQIRNELKSMTDTMYGTASVFAPLVLGLSISMLKPMQTLSDFCMDGSTSTILSIYLCELCAVIALLLSFINGGCRCRDVVGRFSKMAPVSLAVFLVMMNFGL